MNTWVTLLMCFEYGVHRHPRHPLSENPLWAFRPCTPHPQPRVLVITGLWELADLLATVLLPDTAAFPGAEGTVAWSIGSPPEICDALNKTVTLSFSGQTELIHYMQTDRKRFVMRGGFIKLCRLRSSVICPVQARGPGNATDSKANLVQKHPHRHTHK